MQETTEEQIRVETSSIETNERGKIETRGDILQERDEKSTEAAAFRVIVAAEESCGAAETSRAPGVSQCIRTGEAAADATAQRGESPLCDDESLPAACELVERDLSTHEVRNGDKGNLDDFDLDEALQDLFKDIHMEELIVRQTYRRRNRAHRGLHDYREQRTNIHVRAIDNDKSNQDQHSGDERDIIRDKGRGILETEGQQSCEIIETDNIERAVNYSSENDDEIITIAGVRADNRNFITVAVGGHFCRALLDPGATISLVNSDIAERYRDRLKSCNTLVRTVTGKVSRALGVLDATLEIDGHVENIKFKAIPELEQQMILGMDFCRAFDCDTRLGRGFWRVREGE